MEESGIGTDVVTFFGYEVHPVFWELSKTRKDAIAAMIFRRKSFCGAAKYFYTHMPKYAH